jgi:predicted TIM-barrel fold metal-dependent hydrolase
VRSIDVHVHLHPERLARAIMEVFAREGWHAVHGWEPAEVADTLAARGVERFCFFSYAHRPGIARSLNAWLADTARAVPAGIPLGTVHAGDPDLLQIAEEAMDDLGLAGFKFHLSVQRFHADDARLLPFYESVAARGRLLVMHAGTMPYRDEFTGLARFRAVMERFPTLRVIVAHMGAFDTEGFLALTEAYPSLYVDTTMTLTPAATPYVGIDPRTISTELLLKYQDRIMLGSDFPLIPYAYEEERRFVAERALPEAVARKILHDNAARFLGLETGAPTRA